MKFYFGVCGVGLGHVGRCLPVAHRLREMGDDVLFSTYSDGCQYVRQEGFPLCQAPPISYAVKDDGGVDFRQTTVNPGIFSLFIVLNQLRAEIGFMRGFNPDCVISDSRISSILAAKLLGIPVITLLNLYRVRIPREKRFLHLSKIVDGGILTVLGRVWSLGEEILIPDFPQPYTLSEGNLSIPPWRARKVRLIGPILPTKPEELPTREVIRKKIGIKDDFLILVPISGPSKEKMYFSSVIRRLLKGLPGEYKTIMSLGNPDPFAVPLQEGNVTVYPWLQNRFELLKASDLVISRAGLGTLTQTICYGKPLILIPTPSHTEQYNNAKRAERLGVANVMDQKILNEQTFISAVKETSTSSYRRQAEEIGRSVSKYDAVTTMVDTLQNLSTSKA